MGQRVTVPTGAVVAKPPPTITTLFSLMAKGSRALAYARLMTTMLMSSAGWQKANRSSVIARKIVAAD
jgi:hypothetical protein